MYPPTSRDLVKEFAARSKNHDATFSNILARVDALQLAATNSEFANLRAAIGTNDIEAYFPFVNATNETDPTTFILNRLQRDASGKIKLGLDLQGGTAFLVEMDTNALAASLNNGDTNAVARPEDTAGALSQAVEVLRKRVDEFGVAEPVIQPEGANQILIQLPGLSEADKESAATNIQKAAFLEFRMVNEDSDEILANNEPIPPGYEVLKHFEPPENGKPSPPEIVVVKKTAEPGLSGDIVKSAQMGRGNLGEPIIEFELTDAAGKRFGEVTRNNIGRRLAIVLDGQLYSAPNINSEIDNRGEITGHFTAEEAQKLAAVLQNPLRAPLNLMSSYDVDPTLGKDSIHSGIYASVCRRHFGFALHADLLPGGRSHGEHRAGHEHHHFAGRHVFRRHDADAAGHRGRGADHRHGGGRERADLRASPRGTGQGQIAARRHRRRLRPRVRHDFRFARHHADFVRHFDFHGHGRNQGFRRDADHRRGGQLVHRAGRDAADLRLLAGPELAEIAGHVASHPQHERQLHERRQAVVHHDVGVRRFVSLGLRRHVRGKRLFGVDFRGGDSTTFSFAQKVDLDKTSVPP